MTVLYALRVQAKRGDNKSAAFIKTLTNVANFQVMSKLEIFLEKCYRIKTDPGELRKQ